MKKRLLFNVGLAAILLSAARMGAATIETFSVSQGGWLMGVDPSTPVSGALTASFSGAVEPSGLIEQGDLTAFSLTFTDSFGSVSFGLPALSLFSFNVNGGASSLDIAAQSGYMFCEGAAAVLDPACSAVFRPLTVAAELVFASDTSAYTLDAPSIQLVSSVTTNPITTPEPRSETLLLAGLFAVASWRARVRLHRFCRINL